MRYLKVGEVLALYRKIMAQSGGAIGIINLGALESALAQPRQTFEGQALYETVVQKAAILGFSLISGHPFTDGNKRIGHGSMELFLILNGYEIDASTEEQERIILDVAAGQMNLNQFTGWVETNLSPYKAGND